MKLYVTGDTHVLYRGKEYNGGDTIEVKKTDDQLDALLANGMLVDEKTKKQLDKEAAEAKKAEDTSDGTE